MTRRLTLVKGAAQRGTLVYGMRFFDAGAVTAVERARVILADGSSGGVTMHLIDGTPSQIRRQLMESVDAFFELLDERQPEK